MWVQLPSRALSFVELSGFECPYSTEKREDITIAKDCSLTVPRKVKMIYTVNVVVNLPLWWNGQTPST